MVHYGVHKDPALIPRWSRSIQSTTSHTIKIHLNIILPFEPGIYKLSFCFRFSYYNFVCIFYLSMSFPYVLYAHFISSLFDYPDNIWWRSQITKHLIVQFPLGYCYCLPLRSKYSSHRPILYSVWLYLCLSYSLFLLPLFFPSIYL
jgi:hypothetical protein